MWIFDSSYDGEIELWSKTTEDRVARSRVICKPSFYMHLPDPHADWEIIEGLESLFRVDECTFQTIYGPLEGWRIYAGRKVAEKIEIQTRMAARLYNVDVRQDLRYMAEHGIAPCGGLKASRFSPDFTIPLRTMEIRVHGNPLISPSFSEIDVIDGKTHCLRGSTSTILADLFDLVNSCNPDVLLFPLADSWMPILMEMAERHGLTPTFSRTSSYKTMESRSYWSYGKVHHRSSSLMPEGRVLIDSVSSFSYREAGLKGILLASRLTGLSPSMVARFTPGTLISSYEVYEALHRGIAVPFRKRGAERVRTIRELRSCDKGGMMFQPEPGLYELVHELDFTSMYPSIIVKYNLSPEMLDGRAGRGFLSSVLEPLLDLRIRTKQLKKTDPGYKGLDTMLKWMLVTCFGYTGYRNAKFGSIEVHEQITGISREILMQVKEIAENMRFEVLHGIVDCLWVQGGDIAALKAAAERETGILTEVDSYDWIVFLKMADGCGAYNRYYGRLADGKTKIRGIMARQGDTPDYIRRMQEGLIAIMSNARNRAELSHVEPKVREAYSQYLRKLPDADPKDTVIRRRVGRTSYSRRCAEGSAIEAYRRRGLEIEPGMEIGYIVRDASKWLVATEWDGFDFDVGYYRGLMENAWAEVKFVFSCI